MTTQPNRISRYYEVIQIILLCSFAGIFFLDSGSQLIAPGTLTTIGFVLCAIGLLLMLFAFASIGGVVQIAPKPWTGRQLLNFDKLMSAQMIGVIIRSMRLNGTSEQLSKRRQRAFNTDRVPHLPRLSFFFRIQSNILIMCLFECRQVNFDLKFNGFLGPACNIGLT